MLCHFEFRSLHVSLFNVSILKRVSQPTKECGLKTLTLTRRFLHFCYFTFQLRISGLFAQDIRPFQSSIWVATHQNWLQIHFSTTMHIWRLHDMAVTQRGKLPLADQTPVNLFVPVTQWQQDGGPKKKKPMKDFRDVYDALFITGRSVHHGNEENLPKTKSKRSMCQRQKSVYFPDVKFLPVYRGGFWVVSSLLLRYSFHFIWSIQNPLSISRGSLKVQHRRGVSRVLFCDSELVN